MEPYIAYKPGFRSRGVKAAVVYSEIERVKSQEGEVTRENLFESARDESSPIHDEFIWDGEAAVRELGLDRAGNLIRSVIIVPVKGSQEDEQPRRVYVHVEDDQKTGKGHYEQIAIVVHHPDQYELALAELQRKVDAALESAMELKRAAVGMKDADKLASIGLAIEAFGVARAALVAIA